MILLQKMRAQVAAAFVSLFLMLTLGTVVYHSLEKWTWIDSFYFTVVTLATVGYGDLTPTTPGGRLFTALFILACAAIVLAALGIIGSNMLRRREERIVARREARGKDD